MTQIIFKNKIFNSKGKNKKGKKLHKINEKKNHFLKERKCINEIKKYQNIKTKNCIMLKNKMS